MTGAQLKEALEQQYAIPIRPGRTKPAVLAPSDGFAYAVDMSKPEGSRVSGMRLNGKPICTGRAATASPSTIISRRAATGISAFTEGTDVTDMRDHRSRCARRLDRARAGRRPGRTASASCT